MVKSVYKKRVYVAMSGGVDSSVAAAVLKDRGFSACGGPAVGWDVVGVYMKTWSPPGWPCPWRAERRDAMRVCAQLNIPFKTWDFTKEYKERVVDYMIREYAAGRTPNPDVMCNKEIKFGLFFERALAEGADYIATGHYARRFQISDFRFQILRAKALEKDQSYFLWTLSQKHLAKTLFPIGEFKSKSSVREYARNLGLATAEKKDSQGVCFVGPIDVQEFLRGYIPAVPGPVVTISGRKLGRHTGLPFYTIGQCEGIGVGGTGPYYVARKEAATNTLVVAPPAEEEELMSQGLVATDVNWISEAPRDGDLIEAAVRYRQKPVPATINLKSGIINLQFKEPVRAITPGQSVVFYRGAEVLGGGVIR